MSEAQYPVDALVAAFENPLEHLDWWDSQSPQDVVVKLHNAVRAIRASEDETNREIARLILGWTIEETSVSKIALQAAVEQSAISQRKNRISQILNGLTEDQEMANHALVSLWRRRASRCIRVADLPEWMRGCLTKAPGKVKWPDPRDIFWILLSTAMGQPAIVIDGTGTEWLVDSRLDKQRNPKNQMDSILESLADSLSMTGSHVYAIEEYFHSLTQLGVSTSSLASVLGLMMTNPVRRVVVHSGNVLVLSDEDAKNVGRVIQRVMKDLRVPRSEIPKLLADQQQRNPKSVANELGRI